MSVINKTEIIFGNEFENESHEVEGLLNLNVGDNFYFSMSSPSPRAISDYKELNLQGKVIEGFVLKNDFVEEFISNVETNAHKHHIHLLKVISIGKSYSKDYSMSLINPKVTFIESITVKDITYNKFERLMVKIKKFFK
jgi:hypothetical protein